MQKTDKSPAGKGSRPEDIMFILLVLLLFYC